MSSQVLVAQKGEKASVRFVLHGYGSLVCCSSGIIRQFQKGYSRKPADGFSKRLRGSEKAQKEDRGPLSPDPRACLISHTGTKSYWNAFRTRRPPATSSTPAPSTQRAVVPPPVLGSKPLKPLAISSGTPPLLGPTLPEPLPTVPLLLGSPELPPPELPLLLPEPSPLEPPLLGSPPPEPPPSLSEPPEPLHSSGVGLIIGQSSTGKETLAENVLSPSSFTVPKSFITSMLAPLSCTMRTGSDTGSTLGGTGLGPGPNLSTVVLPV